MEVTPLLDLNVLSFLTQRPLTTAVNIQLVNVRLDCFEGLN